MRVLLNKDVDRRLKRSFDGDFEVTTVTDQTPRSCLPSGRAYTSSIT
jgi:hypothetical protein